VQKVQKVVFYTFSQRITPLGILLVLVQHCFLCRVSCALGACFLWENGYSWGEKRCLPTVYYRGYERVCTFPTFREVDIRTCRNIRNIPVMKV